MMAGEIAERLRWAVEMLAVRPSDHLLEIGCGHGVAVSLICEHRFSIRDVLFEDLRPTPAFCVVAEPA